MRCAKTMFGMKFVNIELVTDYICIFCILNTVPLTTSLYFSGVVQGNVRRRTDFHNNADFGKKSTDFRSFSGI